MSDYSTINFFKENEKINKCNIVIIASMHKGKWLYVRNKNREGFEIPGGHVEEGEDNLTAAKRELYEESGAKEVNVYPISKFKIEKQDECAYGELFFAEIYSFEQLPDFEMCETLLCDGMPDNQAYPLSLPIYFNEANEWLVNTKNKCSRERVKGYVRAEGRTIVNGCNEEILLRGPGIGNWLLPEGYMWQFNTDEVRKLLADRPRRIERVFAELAGEKYMSDFWLKFRDTYFCEEDVKAVAEAGFNSIRIAMNSKLFIEEGEGKNLIEYGFSLIDRCLEWCEKYSVYAILDLHGAPGGQTGANIDDCIDDIPRLFLDAHSYEKTLILWKAFAERYKDREIVAAYDILNEPLAPEHSKYKNELMDFYTEAVKVIREVDENHMLSIEGMNWSTNTEIFERYYDSNMIIHFHRYWCPPEEIVYTEFIDVAEKNNAPLWLGESGENTIEWYGKMFPLSIGLNISWNYWPWKRMPSRSPTICEINPPADWEMIKDYINGGKHPGYEKSRAIFDEYLENIKFANVNFKQEVIDALKGNI